MKHWEIGINTGPGSDSPVELSFTFLMTGEIQPANIEIIARAQQILRAVDGTSLFDWCGARRFTLSITPDDLDVCDIEKVIAVDEDGNPFQ